MRATKAIINLNNLVYNFHSIQTLATGAKVMAIVKANAYGHGIRECSLTLQSAGADYFGVAFTEEAVILREAGITKPILVLVSPQENESALICKYDIEVIAHSMPVLRAISEDAIKSGKKVKAHLFINTGMNRDGIKPSEAIGFMHECASLRGIEIYGICTHLATAEKADTSFAEYQIGLFKRTISLLKDSGFSFSLVHAANSAGAINFPEAHFNLIRPGISLYGYNTSELYPQKLKLQPVLSVVTSVDRVIELDAGESVGYGRKFIASEATRIATIPVGYGDGYAYGLSGIRVCLIKGKSFNLVGSICMDQSMVEIKSEDIQSGDEVLLLSGDNDSPVNLLNIANRLNTIPYEILTSILERVPRVYIS